MIEENEDIGEGWKKRDETRRSEERKGVGKVGKGWFEEIFLLTVGDTVKK